MEFFEGIEYNPLFIFSMSATVSGNPLISSLASIARIGVNRASDPPHNRLFSSLVTFPSPFLASGNPAEAEPMHDRLECIEDLDSSIHAWDVATPRDLRLEVGTGGSDFSRVRERFEVGHWRRGPKLRRAALELT